MMFRHPYDVHMEAILPLLIHISTKTAASKSFAPHQLVGTYVHLMRLTNGRLHGADHGGKLTETVCWRWWGM